MHTFRFSGLFCTRGFTMAVTIPHGLVGAAQTIFNCGATATDFREVCLSSTAMYDVAGQVVDVIASAPQCCFEVKNVKFIASSCS
jgi:starvation-inducible outer membrane lipoprotein